MQDNEKTAADQRITATNGAYIENAKQEIHIHSSCAPYPKPAQAHSLTENFVEIPKKEEIKNCLLNGNNSRGILTITAIQGLGGIGKTTLAIVIAHDEEVQKRFSDGILWATLSQEPDKLYLLNSWIQELGDYQSNHIRLETASNHLRTLLYEKSILLVIDDAWDSSDVKPFLVGGPNCQTIITTRKAFIADDLEAKSFPLNVMTEGQSLELFKNILEDCWDEVEKDKALKVAKDVGYLPLALNLAAKRRKRGHSWTELHEALEEEIARLEVLESPQRKRKGEKKPEASLSLKASLNLSLKDLRSCDEDVYEDFVCLGVLPEDVKINKIMSSTLWETNHIEAGDILEFLWGEGLLIQDSKIHLENKELATYRMHDLFRDVARYYLTFSPETKNSTDLPGLGLKLKEAHALLLNRYKSQTQKGMWHTLKDDAYIHSHLTWHLEKAGKIEDIHNLLREESESGKNGWYETLESLELNTVFIEDVIKAWSLSEKESEKQIMQGSKTSFIGLEIRYALVYTSINSLSANIPLELLIAFLETKKWSEAKVFAYAQKEPDLCKRITKLISFYQKTKYEFIKKEQVIDKALDAASKIRFEEERVLALLNILSCSNGKRKEEVIRKTLDEAHKSTDKYWSVTVLSAIASNLDEQRKEEVIDEALDTAFKMKNAHLRAEALYIIATSLNGQSKKEVIEKALDAAYKIKSNYKIAKALSAIASNLDEQRKEEVIEEALDAAYKIKRSTEAARALSAVASNLEEQRKKEVMEKALNAAYKIKIDYKRAEVLSSIASNLDEQRKEKVMEKALDVALNLKDGYGKEAILSRVIPNLNGQRKEELIDKALNAALNLKNDHTRAETLSEFLPYLNGQKKEAVMERALDAASKIEDNYGVTRALTAIASNLDGQRKEEVIEKALDTASKIKDNYRKPEALIAIASNLDGQRKEEVIEKALDAVYKIKGNYSKVEAFCIIATSLDGHRKKEVIEKALDEAYKIKDNYETVETLIAILPSLHGRIKEEANKRALDAALNLKDEFLRAWSLSEIVKNLDEHEKEGIIEEALNSAFKINYDNSRAERLYDIALSLDGQRKKEVMEKAFDTAIKVKNEYDRVKTLSYIVPNLDWKRREEAIKEILIEAYKVEYDDEIAGALSAILPYFDEQSKEEMTKKILNAAPKIEFYDERSRVFNVMIPYLRNLPMSNLYSWWRYKIQISRQLTRSDLLMDITILIAVIGDLSEDETFFEISQAITDVSKWWP